MRRLLIILVPVSYTHLLPEYTVKNGIVSVHVGSVEHPMTPEHYISLIAVQTDRSADFLELLLELLGLVLGDLLLDGAGDALDLRLGFRQKKSNGQIT